MPAHMCTTCVGFVEPGLWLVVSHHAGAGIERASHVRATRTQLLSQLSSPPL